MSWSARMRQIHRWVSLIFTVGAVINIVALVRQEQAQWIGFLALAPLIFLLLSGLYLFALPYVAKRRSPQQAADPKSVVG